MCRAVRLTPTADDMSIKAYIAEALIDQLDEGGKFSDAAKNIINLEVKKVDLQSFDGIWNINITYLIKDKKFQVKTSFKFESSLLGMKACNMARINWVRALEDNFIHFFNVLKTNE